MGRQPSLATVIVGQNSLLREGCARILRSVNFRILASVSCADDLPGKVHPEPSLFLIFHTGNEFGLVAEQIKHFKGSYSNARIAVVADCYRPDALVSAFRAGASGYFVEGITCDVFVRSLELLMMGETVLPTAFLSYVLGPEEDGLGEDSRCEDDNEAILVTDDMAPQLSPREKLILRCLTEGDSNKSIARKIDIAEATVKVHIKAILRKIRVRNRTQAAIWGMNNGCQSRTTIDGAPPLSPEIAKRAPNAMGLSSEIEHGPIRPNGSSKSR
ncbi:MAG: LuxR C-terminal-related transcriptional regulator [Bradyrhizobium sp.]